MSSFASIKAWFQMNANSSGIRFPAKRVNQFVRQLMPYANLWHHSWNLHFKEGKGEYLIVPHIRIRIKKR